MDRGDDMQNRHKMRKGTRHIVTGYRKGGHFRRRLMDLGFTPGTEFRVVKDTPFGDPVVVNVRGYNVSLRKKDLEDMI